MKSNVSDHLRIAEHVLADAYGQCLADFSDLRDLETLRSRVKSEGLSFLTITLPQFCKDFEQALAVGYIPASAFQYFRKAGAIPAFLQVMLGKIFDRETGRINNEVETHPIFVEAVRQVCLFWKKVKLPCAPQRSARAVSNFVEIEQELQSFQIPAERRNRFLRLSRMLWDPLFYTCRVDELVPRHGPGATAERISGNQKYDHRVWHERLERSFPFFGTGVSVSAADPGCDGRQHPDRVCDDACGQVVGFDFERVSFVEAQDEQPVRVTLVPKTLKAPRVIAIEPVCMQYAQQAIQAELRLRLESGWLTRGHVNFRDQSINQRHAVASSISGRLATIDLSDASDRVYADLALEMFNGNPELRAAVEDCRSTRAELPDGRVIGPLVKFASMGSALCFPVESMYFYTILVEVLLESRKLPWTYRSIQSVVENVYVYGDDLIVPAHEASVVLDGLRQYNCKVNNTKSFWTGKFRESCGVDAYDGRMVQPTYLRTTRPENRQQVEHLVSWVATARQLEKRGWWRTAAYMFEACERVLGALPYVEDECAGLGRLPLYPGHGTREWRRGHSRPLVRAWVVDQVYRSDQIDGYPALYKSLLRKGERPVAGPFELVGDDSVSLYARRFRELVDPTDEQHLERTALRGAVTLKRRWVPA